MKGMACSRSVILEPGPRAAVLWPLGCEGGRGLLNWTESVGSLEGISRNVGLCACCVFLPPDPSLRIPSISVSPRRHLVLGSDISIECEGPENGLNFSLHKAGHLIASQMAEPSTNTTSFALSVKRLEDAENYTCRYHHRENPFVWSEPSNPVELFVTGKRTKLSQAKHPMLGPIATF